MTTTAASARTRFATSADGTPIAYEVVGQGPALVLVDGAMCQRTLGHARPLAQTLADRFSIHAYDRRGRGESGPGTRPYAVERELEDLQAVLDAAGGHAHLFGASSGAVLALEAARRGAPVDRLAVYEAPFIVDGSREPNDPRLGQRTQQLVDAGRPGVAATLFLRTVGMPGPVVALMRFLPAWKKMTAVAHTLPHDYAIVLEHQQGQPLPVGHYDGITAPTLVLVGGRSPAYMRNAQAAIAAAVPHAELRSLPGQTHLVKAPVVAAAVAPFLLS